MDRTKEFLSLVNLTEIPQTPFTPTNYYTNIYELKKKIDESFSHISKVTSYEYFRIVPLIETCNENLKELKNVQLNENVTRDHFEVVQNLKSSINTTVLTYQLKLNEIKRKMKTKTNEKQNTNTINSENHEERATNRSQNQYRGQAQDSLLIHQEETRQDQEHFHERKRILRSITEIGQIVEDISIHVRLQEEQLKRIDDIVIQSDRWMKKATNELLDYWEYVKGGRAKIIKYFMMISFAILLFWIIRKV